MSIKSKLKHAIISQLSYDKFGSYASRADRLKILIQCGNQLVDLGYKLKDIRGLKTKHIEALVKHWQKEGISIATQKNRLSAIRRLANGLNLKDQIPSNEALTIGRRCYQPQFNRAQHNPDFSKIKNLYVLVSLHLQRVFGLRKEESIKIKPTLADKDHYLQLLSSWCKGGRPREIPIRTDEQRYWLNQAKLLAQNTQGSLIPKEKSYIQQRYIYDQQTRRAALKNMHGLRHAYAQRRYQELTGWRSPIEGGPTKKALSKQQKIQDKEARLIVTEELGHSRIAIVRNYLK